MIVYIYDIIVRVVFSKMLGNVI